MAKAKTAPSPVAATGKAKDAEIKDASVEYAWHEITDDVKKNLAIIGRLAHSNESVLNLPLPTDNGMLWPVGTLLLDDDGTLYEWR